MTLRLDQFVMAMLPMLAACATPRASVAPPCSELITKWPGWLYLGDYDAVEVLQLAELPQPVQEALTSHLRTRLGDAVFSELVFEGGQVIDHAALLRADPLAADYQWTVPAYVLHFVLSRPESCLDAYHADIWLDEVGRPIQEIDLPAVAAQGGVLRIVSVDQARAAVRALGHAGELPAEIAYRPDLDTLVWLITPSDADVKEGPVIRFVEVVIDARDGRVLASEKREAIE